jgi:hypothetical protein
MGRPGKSVKARGAGFGDSGQPRYANEERHKGDLAKSDGVAQERQSFYGRAGRRARRRRMQMGGESAAQARGVANDSPGSHDGGELPQAGEKRASFVGMAHQQGATPRVEEDGRRYGNLCGRPLAR